MRRMQQAALYVSLAAFVAASSTQADVQGAGVCELCPDMVVIPAGSFEMGEWVNRGYGDVEGPKHTVTFSAPFQMAVAEVSVGEFRRFADDTGHVSEGLCNIYTDTTSWHIARGRNWNDPGFLQDENHPVLCISWADAQAYIAWLNAETGRSYRLPSEAEWEYVASTGGIGSAQGGAITHNNANIGKEECCGGETGGADQWVRTSPIKSFPPDKYGLFDVRGNVWEWQADCYHENYFGAPANGAARISCEKSTEHVVRGGSYGDASDYMSVRFRLPGRTAEGYFTVGFRLAHD
ncbi:MAG: formylglycine-generating enzyme family protein [Pseudomonadota bacterium]